MNKPICLIPLLCVTPLLLSCGEEPGVDSEPKQVIEDPLPGVPIESAQGSKETLTGQPKTLEGDTIPVLDAAGIADLRKQAVDEGKVLVVDCWATWCGSCVAMFPHLHQAMKERGDGVLLVSLSFDQGDDLAKQAAIFLNEQKAVENAYIAAQGPDSHDTIAKALSEAWDGGLFPAVFVYKPDGTVAYEMLETRGEIQDWVDRIASAVDQAAQDALGQ